MSIWEKGRIEKRFEAGIFEVKRVECASSKGSHGLFTCVASRDWAIVVPVLPGPDGNRIVMVRQYRHGAEAIFLEFPGGVIDQGEDSVDGVQRELEEETGYRAGRIILAGSVSPNPAFMENRFHIYVAFDLEKSGTVNLDEHEEIEVELVPLEELRLRMGIGELANAMMVAGLFLAERILKKEGI